MFTGIVETVGRVLALRPGEAAGELRLATSLDPGPVGSSLAVDGVCLTVTAAAGGAVTATVGPETLARTTLGALTAGDRVNLERPLRLTDRLGGHLVAGHVDAVGRIARHEPVGSALAITVEAPPEVLRYVVVKGSIAIDGVSLTVNEVGPQGFGVTLIPHTLAETTLPDKRPGARVNLEADLIGKYVEKLLAPREEREGLTLEFLARHGFA